MSTASGTQGVSVTGGMPGTTDLDSWRSIVALLWLGFVGLATFQLIPLLTGQMVDVYGFGDAKAEKYGEAFLAAIREETGRKDETGRKPD